MTTKRCVICRAPATTRVLMNGKNGYRMYDVCEKYPKCADKKKALHDTASSTR